MFEERDSIEAALFAAWTRALGNDPEGLDADFFMDGGGDSFTAIMFLSILREDYEWEVDLAEFMPMPTVRATAQRVRGSGTSSTRLFSLRRGGDGAPLVVAPNTAGSLVGLGRFGSSIFDRPIYGLQSSGFYSHETCYRELTPLVEEFADIVHQNFGSEPLHLAGYCIGGIFAYDLADRLQDRGLEVLSVNLLNTSLDAHAEIYEDLYNERLGDLLLSSGYASHEIDRLGALDAKIVFDAIRQRRDILEDNFESFARRVAIFVSNWYASTQFIPSILDLPVNLFETADRVGKGQLAGNSTRLDWKDLDLPRLRVVELESTHYEMFNIHSNLERIEDILVHVESRCS